MEVVKTHFQCKEDKLKELIHTLENIIIHWYLIELSANSKIKKT